MSPAQGHSPVSGKYVNIKFSITDLPPIATCGNFYRMARIAIIDLLFNWPPDGGARVDIKEIASRLAPLHEVRLFAPDFRDYFPRGRISGDLPFDIKLIPFTTLSFNRMALPRRFRKKIDAFSPDHVFIADGWHMKPYVVNALRKYRPILRMYAYELLCLKDYGTLFKEGSVCPKNILSNPLSCMLCSLRYNRWSNSPLFAHEYVMSTAFLPTHRQSLLRSLRNSSKVIVYNSYAKGILDRYHPDVVLAPSAIDTDFFKPQPGRALGGPPVVLMPSRIGDAAKGYAVFVEAIRILIERKRNLRAIVPSYSDMGSPPPGIEYTKWYTPAELPRLYNTADICVIPSVWLEPFGIAAIEAMACGVPVVASRTGGLADIITDGENGLLFAPGDAAMLAGKIALLLDNAEMRERIGVEGRRKALEAYDWTKIMSRIYLPLFEGM